ncbi:acyl-CoA dehydrogenase family protein [Adlercreutzia sp. ZJ138]|uniref:acyl-CoA dehydrogenase family protein n=1 Tax=Adlercreutzia sp. ZJ138 TaxID=2709405 RepID=UPI0013EDFD70|nr:acyl-CoA dehydrogenase family protein [Adlercreutzia sp. ZJ138]
MSLYSKYLTEDEQLIIDAAEEFRSDVLEPRVMTDLEREICPMDVLEQMRELGFTNASVPEEAGGFGGSMTLQCALDATISQASLAMAFMGCSNPIATLLARVGTPEQIELFMPGLLSGQGGLGFTEPNAGSDSSGITTTAVKDGDEWVINGQKTFISYINVFDYFLVSALTNETEPGGASVFLVHKDTPGFKVGSMFHKIGLHGSNTGELFFEDMRVPAINMIGKENHGLRYVLAVLDSCRLANAACAIGIAQGALEKATMFAKQRVTFGKPICKHQGISWYFAEMEARLSAARSLVFDVARDCDEGKNITAGAAKAKWIAGQTAMFVTDRAIQICGGYGLTEDFGVARLFRDARVIPIVEGTDEVLKIVISRDVLK